MRWIAIGVLLACVGSGTAGAAPFHSVPDKGSSLIEQIRWECNENRCLDTRSGAYTESTCDYRGCRPGSGVVGYTDPRTSPQYPRYRRYGYDRGYGYPPPPPPRYYDEY